MVVSKSTALLRSGMAVLLVFVLALSIFAVPVRAASSGSFSGAYADWGLDTNANGLYDYLDVSAGITVVTPGTFHVSLYLWDSNWTTVIAATWGDVYYDRDATFIAGFDGPSIHRAGFDGPYHVNWYLYDDNYNWLDSGFSTTAAYAAADFEGPQVAFVLPVTDVGIDTNGNGLYDVLDVNATIGAQIAGEYTVSAMIHDPSYTYTDYTSVEQWFDVGQTAVSLSFLGTKINAAGMDGSYTVDLNVYNSSSMVNYDYTTHVTQAYLASQFEAPPGRLVPPCHDSLNDSNGDGLWDWIYVDVPFEVGTPGYYDIRGQMVSNASYTYMGYDFTYGAYGTGLHTARLQFSTMAASLAHADGPYRVMLDLLYSAGPMGPWSTIMSGVHYTAAYSSADFAPPAATIGSPITDQGVDRSSPPDGRYDVLEVTVPLDVTTPGTYEIWAYMDNTWAYEDTSAYLNPGAQTMTLDFSGAQIAMRGVDGPYTIDIELSLILGGRYLQLESYYPYVTGPYAASDFAPVTPATLAGTVTETETGLPVPSAMVEAYNYTSQDDLWTYTAVDGTYELPVYAGDWVVMVDGASYQGQLIPMTVGAPVTTFDPTLAPSVQQTADVNLTFSDWNTAARDRWWDFTNDNATARQYYDWYYGNRDGYVSVDELLASQGNASDLPEPVPTNSASLFQVDGQTYGTVPGSDSFTWGNIEGSIFDPSPMTGLQTGSFAASVAASPVHTVTVNVSYDLWYNDRIYTVQLPSGYVATDITAATDVIESGLGTGTVVLNPGLDPAPYDGNDSVWITITAASADTVPPSVSAVQATPDPAELGASVAIDATVSDTSGVSSVAVLVKDPSGATVGNFTMGNVAGDEYAYALTADAVGSYQYRVWAQDAVGNVAFADGSFVVVDTTPPSITALSATPNPAEAGSPTTIRATVTDLQSVQAVFVEFRDANGFTYGNLTMTGSGDTYSAAFTPTVPIPLTYTVWAQDVDGNWASASGTLNVVDTTPPVIVSHSATPSPQEIGVSVQFQAQITDNFFVAGASVEVHGPDGSLVGNYSLTHFLTPDVWQKYIPFNVPGTYTYTLWAWDQEGHSASASGSFVMEDTTAPALTGVMATPNPVERGGTVNLSAAATDLGGVASVKVEVRDPQSQVVGNFSMAKGTGNTFWKEIVPGAVGTYMFTITVTDASGNVKVAAGSFVVQDTTPPVASAGPDQNVVQGTTVTFDGSGSTDNDAIATYTWTFSDGGAKTLTGAHPTYTFSHTGTYTVTLTVTDPSGNTATDTMTVTVTALPPTTGTVSGTVKESGGQAIAGATVQLLSGTTQVATTTADSQGAFTFSSVAPGIYTVKATASGYDASTTSVTVVAGQTAQAALTLTLTAVTPPPAIDWIPIVAVIAGIAAVAVGLIWYLRRRKT